MNKEKQCPVCGFKIEHGDTCRHCLAVELGRLGGQKTAEKGSEYFKQLSKKGRAASKKAVQEFWKKWRLEHGAKENYD